MKEVVADEELPDVERLPVLHVVRTPDLDDENVGQADEKGRQGTRHQEQVISPGEKKVKRRFKKKICQK